MVKSLIISGSVVGVNSVTNTTTYWNVAGSLDTGTTENIVKVRIYEAGIISHFHIKLSGNTIPSGNSTFTVRKNTTNTTMTISVAGSNTGTFEDITHTESISSGDYLNIITVPGAATGLFTMTYIYMVFTPTTTTNCLSILSYCHPTGRTTLTTASTRYFQGLNGYFESGSTTEAAGQHKMQIAGTFRNFTTYVVSNSRTTTTIAELRKGGVSQSLTTTYTSTATLEQSDTTNTVAAVDNDIFNFSILNGTGTLSISWGHLAVEFLTTGSPASSMYIGYNQVAAAQALSLTRFYDFAGWFNAQSTESTAQMDFPVNDFTAKNMGVNITQHSITPNASTFTFRKNGANTALTVSIAALATGWFEDATDSVTLVDGDDVNYSLISGSGSAGQTITLRGYLIHLEATSGAVDTTVTGKAIATKQIIHG